MWTCPDCGSCNAQLMPGCANCSHVRDPNRFKSLVARHEDFKKALPKNKPVKPVKRTPYMDAMKGRRTRSKADSKRITTTRPKMRQAQPASHTKNIKTGKVAPKMKPKASKAPSRPPMRTKTKKHVPKPEYSIFSDDADSEHPSQEEHDDTDEKAEESTIPWKPPQPTQTANSRSPRKGKAAEKDKSKSKEPTPKLAAEINNIASQQQTIMSEQKVIVGQLHVIQSTMNAIFDIVKEIQEAEYEDEQEDDEPKQEDD